MGAAGLLLDAARPKLEKVIGEGHVFDTDRLKAEDGESGRRVAVVEVEGERSVGGRRRRWLGS